VARILLNFRGRFPGLREGFEALGHEVHENDWTPEPAALEGAALCVADFVDCARRVRRTLGLKRRLEHARVPFLALSRDAPFHRGVHPSRLAVIAWLHPFAGYAAHSLQQAQRYARRTLYCPNAARASLYRTSADELAAMRAPSWFRWDASFVGNLDEARYPEHSDRVGFLRALADRLRADRIGLLLRDGGSVSEAEQIEIIKRSRINLSAAVAADGGQERSWGLPERCYGVPACGGFLLSDRRRHAAEDFAPEEWAEYADLDDCAARIREFLAAPGRARAIAERAQARVARDHTYRDRAERLLDFAAKCSLS
jgi:spore maturation protein CgeB